MRKLLGAQGEAIAQKVLITEGYKIIKTNFTCPLGEIDLIAWDRNVLVFVEVRSRSDSKYGYPSETVNYLKQRKIRKVAQYFLVVNDLEEAYCRFDVVSIIWGKKNEKPQIEIFQDAFW